MVTLNKRLLGIWLALTMLQILCWYNGILVLTWSWEGVRFKASLQNGKQQVIQPFIFKGSSTKVPPQHVNGGLEIWTRTWLMQQVNHTATHHQEAAKISPQDTTNRGWPERPAVFNAGGSSSSLRRGLQGNPAVHHRLAPSSFTIPLSWSGMQIRDLCTGLLRWSLWTPAVPYDNFLHVPGSHFLHGIFLMKNKLLNVFLTEGPKLQRFRVPLASQFGKHHKDHVHTI